jgi:hypothetical protein
MTLLAETSMIDRIATALEPGTMCLSDSHPHAESMKRRIRDKARGVLDAIARPTEEMIAAGDRVPGSESKWIRMVACAKGDVG